MWGISERWSLLRLDSHSRSLSPNSVEAIIVGFSGIHRVIPTYRKSHYLAADGGRNQAYYTEQSADAPASHLELDCRQFIKSCGGPCKHCTALSPLTASATHQLHVFISNGADQIQCSTCNQELGCWCHLATRALMPLLTTDLALLQFPMADTVEKHGHPRETPSGTTC
jgi:hypothetical protein